MATRIISNGSKWAGEPPDDLGALFVALATETLEPDFERYGNFAEFDRGKVRFFGNFRSVSHVFQIVTDDAMTAAALVLAIRANQATARYRKAREGMALPVMLPREEGLTDAA
jgi:hypothetical protein